MLGSCSAGDVFETTTYTEMSGTLLRTLCFKFYPLCYTLMLTKCVAYSLFSYLLWLQLRCIHPYHQHDKIKTIYSRIINNIIVGVHIYMCVCVCVCVYRHDTNVTKEAQTSNNTVFPLLPVMSEYVNFCCSVPSAMACFACTCTWCTCSIVPARAIA